MNAEERARRVEALSRATAGIGLTVASAAAISPRTLSGSSASARAR